jgi:hypothetical protein
LGEGELKNKLCQGEGQDEGEPMPLVVLRKELGVWYTPPEIVQ